MPRLTIEPDMPTLVRDVFEREGFIMHESIAFTASIVPEHNRTVTILDARKGHRRFDIKIVERPILDDLALQHFGLE